jgi:hypothetical protein
MTQSGASEETSRQRPRRDVRERGIADHAVPELRTSAPSDEPTALEHLDVLGDRWESQIEWGGQFVDAGLTVSEASEDRPPCRVGRGRESLVKPRIVERPVHP